MTDDPNANNQPLGYVPPAIWTWNKENGGQFASINRRSPALSDSGAGNATGNVS